MTAILLSKETYPTLHRLIGDRTVRVRRDGAIIGQAANGQWKYLGHIGDPQVAEEIVKLTSIEDWNTYGSVAYEVEDYSARAPFDA